MISSNNSHSHDVNNFVNMSSREVKIWDILARAVPMSSLIMLAVLHFFEATTLIELILEILLGIFFVSCFIWWYWAIIKISQTVRHMQNTQLKFNELAEELRSLRRAVSSRSPDNT